MLQPTHLPTKLTWEQISPAPPAQAQACPCRRNAVKRHRAWAYLVLKRGENFCCDFHLTQLKVGCILNAGN